MGSETGLPKYLSALDLPLSHDIAFSALEKEFCPLLDSSLVAALLADIDFKSQPESSINKSLQSLCEMLASIAQHAEAEAISDIHLDMDVHRNQGAHSPAGVESQVGQARKASKRNVKSRSRSETSTTNTTTTTTTTDNGPWKSKSTATSPPPSSSASDSESTSPSCASDQGSVDPQALAFLRAALPQLSTRTLVHALVEWEASQRAQKTSGPSDAIEGQDIWTLICQLVASEDAREMDERGIDTDSEHDGAAAVGGAASQGVADTAAAHATSLEMGLFSLYDDRDFDFANYTDPADQAYLSQLESDEKMARALALELEEEERRTDPLMRVLGRKQDRDNEPAEEWVSTKGGKKGKAKKDKMLRGKAKSGEAGKKVVRLGDVRQQVATTSTHLASKHIAFDTSKITLDATVDAGTINNASVDLSSLLPSLSSYITSLLPPSRPPSTMFLVGLGIGRGRSKPTHKPEELSTYIQNVYLNERVVKNKYGGRIYRAVRSCLESVLEVQKEVQARREAEAQKQQDSQAAVTGAEELHLQVNSEGDKAAESSQAKRGSDEEEQREKQYVILKREGRSNKRKKNKIDNAGKFPPEAPPPRPSGKMKNRVRTATDRALEAEREPGEGKKGVAEEEGKADEETEDEPQTLLLTLLDILLPQYALIETGGGTYMDVHQLVSDIELCVSILSGAPPSISGTNATGSDLKATEGPKPQKEVGETALDLVTLLCDLFVSDAEPGREAGMFREIMSGEGVGGSAAAWGNAKRQVLSYAETAGVAQNRQSSGPGGYLSQHGSMARGANQLGLRNALEGSSSMPAKSVGETAGGSHKPSPYQWQSVKTRKAPSKPARTLLPHLPTYTRDVNGIRHRTTNSEPLWEVPGSLSGERASLSELTRAEAVYRQKIADNHRRRDELLHEAARMYNRGSKRSLGSNIAWYFAERAREYTEAARVQELNAARTMVYRKQAVSGQWDTVDLHGTTVAEAEVIVLELLEGHGSAKSNGPLKIITGRGSHSVGGQSVLKPALRKKLVAEGYTVRGWDAGLVVTGPLRGTGL